MRVARSPTGSELKLAAIREALATVWPWIKFEVQAKPVELQARPDLGINAQPEGGAQTQSYVRARWREMCRQHGLVPDLDIVVESGAIDGLDVAVVGIYLPAGNEVIKMSRGIPFPDGTLEEARRRGFKTTTAGDIIHERWGHIPANDWQVHFPPHVARKDQIREAVEAGLRDAPVVYC